MTRTLVFTNRKGGVGKTTTTVNVAAALAHMGRSVLVVDGDPQAHATMSFGIHRNKIRYDLADVATGRVSAEKALQSTYISRLKVLPATRRLADFERRYADDPQARVWFRDGIDLVKRQFDFVCFDTPPTTQLLTHGSLIAGDDAYVPLQAHFLALEGLVEIIELIESVRRQYQPSLRLAGIIPTFYDDAGSAGTKILAELNQQFGEDVVLRPVRLNSILAEAPQEGHTVFQHRLRSSAAFDYYVVAQQIMSR